MPMHGEYYRYENEDTGELKGYEGVYALGNVLTGQGNIRVSRRHATTITHHVIASYSTLSGTFASINRPIAGATHEKELPVGKHPLQLYSLATPNGVKVTVLLEELL